MNIDSSLNEFWALTYISFPWDNSEKPSAAVHQLYCSWRDAETARQTKMKPDLYQVIKVRFSSGFVAESENIPDQFPKVFYKLTMHERLIEALCMCAEMKIGTKEFSDIVDGLISVENFAPSDGIKKLIAFLKEIKESV